MGRIKKIIEIKHLFGPPILNTSNTIKSKSIDEVKYEDDEGNIETKAYNVIQEEDIYEAIKNKAPLINISGCLIAGFDSGKLRKYRKISNSLPQNIDSIIVASNTVFFESSTDFRSIKFLKGVDFTEATFNGDTYFRYSIFKIEPNFLSSNFLKEVDFTETHFEEDAIFSYTSFLKETKFIGAKFLRGVDFTESKLSGITKISNSNFNGNVDFSRSNFGASVIVMDSNFNGHVSFNHTKFKDKFDFIKTSMYGEISFKESKFFGEANFGDMIFSGKVDFSDSTFSGKADFRDSSYADKTDFSFTTFSEKAEFNTSIFLDKVDFKYATFNNNADFSSSTFSDKADFNTLTFYAEANFKDSTFAKEADFSFSTFSGIAKYGDSTFSGNVDFNEARFFEIAFFNNVNFSKEIRFSQAEFSKAVDFRNSIFLGLANFDKLIAHKSYFRGSVFEKLVIFNEANIKTGDRETYRIVKHSFLQINNRLDAFIYLDKEMEEKRKESKFLGLEYLVLFFYKCLNNYGTSFVRSSIMFVLFITLLSTLLLNCGLETSYFVWEWNGWSEFFEATFTSIHYAAVLLNPAHRTDDLVAISNIKLSQTGQFINAISRFLVPIMIFFFLQPLKKYKSW